MPDPICGFIAGPHIYSETAQIKQGLSVDLIAPQPVANQPVTLRFFVHQKPRNMPVDQLQIEHEKFIHVIGVRDDLRDFFHLHPIRVSPGMWEVRHTFFEPGSYKIWTDVKSRGISYSLGLPPVKVVGETSLNNSASNNVSSTSVYRVSFTHSEPLVSTGTNQLQFVIRDGSGNPVEVENFLGAPMHLVILKDDLTTFLHAHPEPRRPADAPIRFNQTFSQPGNYKLFAQFRPKSSQFEANEAVLEEFSVTVAAGISNRP